MLIFLVTKNTNYIASKQTFKNIEKVVLNCSNLLTLQNSKINTNNEVTLDIVVTKEQKDILVILDKVSTPDIS